MTHIDVNVSCKQIGKIIIIFLYFLLLLFVHSLIDSDMVLFHYVDLLCLCIGRWVLYCFNIVPVASIFEFSPLIVNYYL